MGIHLRVDKESDTWVNVSEDTYAIIKAIDRLTEAIQKLKPTQEKTP